MPVTREEESGTSARRRAGGTEAHRIDGFGIFTKLQFEMEQCRTEKVFLRGNAVLTTSLISMSSSTAVGSQLPYELEMKY